jgi:hypothetical protein
MDIIKLANFIDEFSSLNSVFLIVNNPRRLVRIKRRTKVLIGLDERVIVDFILMSQSILECRDVLAIVVTSLTQTIQIKLNFLLLILLNYRRHPI